MSVCALYYSKMRVGMCVNALYIILLNWEFLCVWCALYDIIEMRACLCLNANYKTLKWGLLCVWMRFKWYY